MSSGGRNGVEPHPKALLDKASRDFCARFASQNTILGPRAGWEMYLKKKAWYFHTETFRKTSHKKLSMDDIRSYYGTTKVQRDQRELLEA